MNPQIKLSPELKDKADINDSKQKDLDKEDAIEEALKSISQIEKDKDRREFIAIREVINLKKNQTGYREEAANDIKEKSPKELDAEIDIFDENDN